MANGLRLGISTIEDLLINNRISRNEESKQIEGVRLAIPEYQRPYKWTAKNANQLLDDIIEAMNDNKEVYRVGTLILHNDNGVYDIVDGQQRVITFALLLKILGFEQSVSFLNQKVSDNNYTIRNVMNNYRSMKKRLEPFIKDVNASPTKNDDKLKEYIKTNCEFIIVITTDLSEAFQFFDSQNARGKALYPHDLLKAYHLREMRSLDDYSTEQIVSMWENMDQRKLSELFSQYLYRLKEWINGNRSYALNEQNIDLFKGVTSRDNFPYAQYYKGAFAYAEELNSSQVPFVTGIHNMKPFQLNAPIIAGKPFFEYAKHYFDILEDIQNNDKYSGYFINDNEIVKTLDLRDYKNGIGNGITRLMFDTAILLYVDRFCPTRPSALDLELLEQFVDFAFIWAYSMRAQYKNVGWLVAQNYIMNTSKKGEILNSFNIFKEIAGADSPRTLLNNLSDRIVPLNLNMVVAKKDNIDDKDSDGVYKNYLHFFKKNGYLEVAK